jgi:hypothetical protein
MRRTGHGHPILAKDERGVDADAAGAPLVQTLGAGGT